MLERDAYSEQPDASGYKLRAFSNAIKVIERLDKPITSGKEALKVRAAYPRRTNDSYNMLIAKRHWYGHWG